MLKANKAALEHQVRLQALEIQNEELQFFVRSMNTLSTCSSFMAGFAYAGLGQVAIAEIGSDETKYHGYSDMSVIIARSLFYGLISLSMIANLTTMIISAVAQIRGPSLSLRGPEGSLERAVKGLRKVKKRVTLTFRLGVYCLVLSCYPYMCITWEPETAACASVVLTLSFFALLKQEAATVKLFKLPKGVVKETGELQMKLGQESTSGQPLTAPPLTTQPKNSASSTAPTPVSPPKIGKASSVEIGRDGTRQELVAGQKPDKRKSAPIFGKRWGSDKK